MIDVASWVFGTTYDHSMTAEDLWAGGYALLLELVIYFLAHVVLFVKSYVRLPSAKQNEEWLSSKQP
jgi:hypothetical protein